MPSKKKKYNARFPPARIKKIMQTDEDVGKVAAAVPVIISRALEKFIETLIVKSSEITQSRNAKTLTTSHIKQTVNNEKKFDFLKDLMATVPDHQTEEDSEKSSTSGENKKTKVSRPRKQSEHKKKKRKRATSDSSEENEGENANEEEMEDDSETETDNEGESQEVSSVQDSMYTAGPSSSNLPISNIQASSSHVTHSSQSDEGIMPQLSHPAMMMSQAARMANPAMSLHSPFPTHMGAMPLSMPKPGADGSHPVGPGVQDAMQFKNKLVQHGPQIGLCNKIGPYPPGMFPPTEFPYPGPLPHLMGGQATYQPPSMFSTQHSGLPFHNNGMQRNDSFSRSINSNCSKEPENLCSKDSDSKTPAAQEPMALNLSMGVRKAVSEDDDYDT